MVIVYSVQRREECSDLYRSEETTTPQWYGTTEESQLIRTIYICTPTFEKGSLLRIQMFISWTEKGVKEVIYVKLEQPAINSGLTHNTTSVMCNALEAFQMRGLIKTKRKAVTFNSSI